MAYSFTDQQARAYYQTLTPEQQQQVDASGGPSVQWFTNAVNAGVPQAVMAAGGKSGQQEGGWQGAGDAWLDPSQAADSSEWMGKRNPTPQEMRKWAQQQHAAYTGGDSSAQDEDYARYGDAQVAAWINEGWDAAKGGWKQGYNPTGAASQMQGGSGGGGGGGGYGGGGGSFGQAGGVPQFNFTAPSMQDLQNDPGYQAQLQAGLSGIEHSAAAKGMLRTGNTVSNLAGYANQFTRDAYRDLYDRQYTYAKDKFAPQYGGWNTMYQGDLSRWTTNQNNALRRYGINQGNIYGMLMGTQPVYGGFQNPMS